MRTGESDALKPIILAALTLALTSCMLVKNQFAADDAPEPPVSVEPPPFFTDLDTEFEETYEAYALYADTPYYVRDFSADIEVVELAALVPVGKLAERELVTVLGEDITGAFAIVKTQFGTTAYVISAMLGEYLPESMYKLAYAPDSGVNAARLAELGSVLTDSVMRPLLYEENNFLSAAPAQSKPYILLDIKCAVKLLAAQEAALAQGYTLVFLNGYHSQSIQYGIYKKVNNELIVPNPKDLSRNARGVAVDVTLADADGTELAMPSSPFAYSAVMLRPFYSADALQRQNAKILEDIMLEAGFLSEGHNWWHFYDPAPDYIITNLSFDDMFLTVWDRER
ncbi:MAG: hypothetical protein LBI44_00030 [Oscillospiraceae bacterium]|jgi:D-alanyl-D-alanine dipeptidase|nr:hypothetical protein [Oscillospiraceae bacterium]